MPLDVLRQPVRIRILEICTEWERISPSEMVDEGLLADIESLRDMTPKQKLTNVAYHCRKLKEFGFLAMVGVEPKRGAIQHFYKANTETFLDGEEWAGMDDAQRQNFTRVAWQRLIAQGDDSIRQEVFNARTDRWLVWGPLDLDEQGWHELMGRLSETYDDIERMKREAEARLAQSDEVPIRVTYALLGFESPERPAKAKPKRKPKSRHRSSK
jgi:hypothetical protein